MVKKFSDAEYIKGLIIDYLLSIYPDIVIGNEVMYGSSRKVADLVIIRENQIIAIEVKSKNDNLSRLEEQIKAYKTVFDGILIFSTTNHFKSILESISDDVGLFEINNLDEIKIVRKPKSNHKQDKVEMLLSMNSIFLKKKVAKSYLLNSDQVRQTLLKQSKKNIHTMLYEYLTEKIKPNFNSFISDRGVVTSADDIPTLSSGLFIHVH